MAIPLPLIFLCKHNKIPAMLNLQDAFQKVRTDLPGIVGSAQPLGVGTFGIALENPDQTVTKLNFNISQPHGHPNLERMFDYEISALRQFGMHPMDGITVPMLIGAPCKLDHPDYVGVYTMTKIDGHTGFLPDQSPALDLAQAHSAGRMLAKFHRAVNHLDFNETLGAAKTMGSHTTRSSLLNDEMNDALGILENYLQTHKEAGVVHGDFNTGNLKANGDQITGILDFSFTGMAPNILSDFILMPVKYLDGLIDGYEHESKKSIRDLVHATQVSYWSNSLLNVTEKADQAKALTEISRHLGKLSHITGFKP